MKNYAKILITVFLLGIPAAGVSAESDDCDIWIREHELVISSETSMAYFVSNLDGVDSDNPRELEKLLKFNEPDVEGYLTWGRKTGMITDRTEELLIRASYELTDFMDEWHGLSA